MEKQKLIELKNLAIIAIDSEFSNDEQKHTEAMGKLNALIDTTEFPSEEEMKDILKQNIVDKINTEHSETIQNTIKEQEESIKQNTKVLTELEESYKKVSNQHTAEEHATNSDLQDLDKKLASIPKLGTAATAGGAAASDAAAASGAKCVTCEQHIFDITDKMDALKKMSDIVKEANNSKGAEQIEKFATLLGMINNNKSKLELFNYNQENKENIQQTPSGTPVETTANQISVQTAINVALETSETIKEQLRGLEHELLQTQMDENNEHLEALDRKSEEAAKAVDTKISEAEQAVDTKIHEAEQAVDTKIHKAEQAVDAKIVQAITDLKTLESSIEKNQTDFETRIQQQSEDVMGGVIQQQEKFVELQDDIEALKVSLRDEAVKEAKQEATQAVDDLVQKYEATLDKLTKNAEGLNEGEKNILINELTTSVQQKIEENEKEHQESITALTQRLDDQVKLFEGKQKELENKINLNDDMNVFEADRLEEQLAILEQLKERVEQTNTLTRRVEEHTEQIAALETTSADQATKITTLETTSEKQTQDIDELKKLIKQFNAIDSDKPMKEHPNVLIEGQLMSMLELDPPNGPGLIIRFEKISSGGSAYADVLTSDDENSEDDSKLGWDPKATWDEAPDLYKPIFCKTNTPSIKVGCERREINYVMLSHLAKNWVVDVPQAYVLLFQILNIKPGDDNFGYYEWKTIITETYTETYTETWEGSTEQTNEALLLLLKKIQELLKDPKLTIINKNRFVILLTFIFGPGYNQYLFNVNRFQNFLKEEKEEDENNYPDVQDPQLVGVINSILNEIKKSRIMTQDRVKKLEVTTNVPALTLSLVSSPIPGAQPSTSRAEVRWKTNRTISSTSGKFGELLSSSSREVNKDVKPISFRHKECAMGWLDAARKSITEKEWKAISLENLDKDYGNISQEQVPQEYKTSLEELFDYILSKQNAYMVATSRRYFIAQYEKMNSKLQKIPLEIVDSINEFLPGNCKDKINITSSFVLYTFGLIIPEVYNKTLAISNSEITELMQTDTDVRKALANTWPWGQPDNVICEEGDENLMKKLIHIWSYYCFDKEAFIKRIYNMKDQERPPNSKFIYMTVPLNEVFYKNIKCLLDMIYLFKYYCIFHNSLKTAKLNTYDEEKFLGKDHDGTEVYELDSGEKPKSSIMKEYISIWNGQLRSDSDNAESKRLIEIGNTNFTFDQKSLVVDTTAVAASTAAAQDNLSEARYFLNQIWWDLLMVKVPETSKKKVVDKIKLILDEGDKNIQRAEMDELAAALAAREGEEAAAEEEAENIIFKNLKDVLSYFNSDTDKFRNALSKFIASLGNDHELVLIMLAGLHRYVCPTFEGQRTINFSEGPATILPILKIADSVDKLFDNDDEPQTINEYNSRFSLLEPNATENNDDKRKHKLLMFVFTQMDKLRSIYDNDDVDEPKIIDILNRSFLHKDFDDDNAVVSLFQEDSLKGTNTLIVEGAPVSKPVQATKRRPQPKKKKSTYDSDNESVTSTLTSASEVGEGEKKKKPAGPPPKDLHASEDSYSTTYTRKAVYNTILVELKDAADICSSAATAIQNEIGSRLEIINYKFDQNELKNRSSVRKDANFTSFDNNLNHFYKKLKEYKALESVRTAPVGSDANKRVKSAEALYNYLKKWWGKVKEATESLKIKTFKTTWEYDNGVWPELRGMPTIHAGGGKAPNRLALRKTNNKYSFKNKKSKRRVAKIKYKHSLRKHGKKNKRFTAKKRN